MKGDEMEEILKKYKESMSTLSEEKTLLEHSEHTPSAMKGWFAFIKRNRRKAPAGFNERMWKEFEGKVQKPRKRYMEILAVAASLILLVAVFWNSPGDDIPAKEEKLSQALQMFEDAPQPAIDHDILYEDDMIIVYSTKKTIN